MNLGTNLEEKTEGYFHYYNLQRGQSFYADSSHTRLLVLVLVLDRPFCFFYSLLLIYLQSQKLCLHLYSEIFSCPLQLHTSLL